MTTVRYIYMISFDRSETKSIHIVSVITKIPGMTPFPVLF